MPVNGLNSCSDLSKTSTWIHSPIKIKPLEVPSIIKMGLKNFLLVALSTVEHNMY